MRLRRLTPGRLPDRLGRVRIRIPRPPLYLLLLLAFGLSQVSVQLHHALVKHRVCEVHGQLEHGPEHGGHHTDEPSSHAPSTDGPVAIGIEEAHGEQCGLDPVLRPRALPIAGSAVATGWVPGVGEGLPQIGRHLPAVRTLELAPKHSPPSVG